MMLQAFSLSLYANNTYYIFENQHSSLNSFGETGLIVLPSAEIKDAG